MKAVIVEIRGLHAAALADNGCIIKVRNQNYAIGQVIEMKKQVFKKPAKVVALASAAAAVVMMCTVTAWAYCTPYSYVSLDVNPSIEYSVNRFNRVLSAEAVNGDGEKILADLDLNNKTIEEAIQDTVGQIDKAGYFTTEDPGGIVIATSSENEQDSQKLAADLQSTAEQSVEDTTAPVEVEAVSVGYERVQKARALGTTPGKLNLVEKLQASMDNPDSVDVQEWLKKPVKEIMKAIKTAKKASKTGDSQDSGADDSSSSVSSDTGTSSAQSGISSEEASSQAAEKSAVKNKSQSKTTGDTVSKLTGKSVSAKNANGGSKTATDTGSKVTGKPADGNGNSGEKASANTGSKVTGKSNTEGNGNSESKSAGKSDAAENGNGGSKKTDKSGKK